MLNSFQRTLRGGVAGIKVAMSLCPLRPPVEISLCMLQAAGEGKRLSFLFPMQRYGDPPEGKSEGKSHSPPPPLSFSHTAAPPCLIPHVPFRGHSGGKSIGFPCLFSQKRKIFRSKWGQLKRKAFLCSVIAD